MTETSRPRGSLRQGRDAVSNRLGEGGVLVNLRTNRIFELNATGMRAWELIGEGHTKARSSERWNKSSRWSGPASALELATLIGDIAREGLVDADPDG